MQQIQLSQVKFSEEEIAGQEEELNSKINLLIKTVAIDEITILFFYSEGESEIHPQTEFCHIIKKCVPPTKANQIEAIERLTFCFYSLLVQSKLKNLAAIQMHFQSYLDHTTYVSVFVDFHEKVRKWCKELSSVKNFTKSKENLMAIFLQIKEKSQKRLEILAWKTSVCLILFEIISGKNKIQRNDIIKLLKSFKSLKKQNKISTKPVLDAFKFMIKYFISKNNDIYIFFEREIKIWCQQIVDNSLISEMKSIINQCEQMSAQSLKITTNEVVEQKVIQKRKFNPSTGRKIVMNTLNPHMFYQSNPGLISGRRLIRRRPSREQDDKFQKKIDHFFKTRVNKIHQNSLQTTSRQPSHDHLKVSIKISQKPSLSLHSMSRFTLDQATIFKNTIKSNTQDKKSEMTLKQTSKISLSASKSASLYSKKGGTRKRKQIYQKVVRDDSNKNQITNKHLRDQMLQISLVQEERCKITLEQILIGQFKKAEADQNIKFIGVSEDNQFGNLKLSFFTIFNQELAQILFTIKKVSKQGYILSCQTKSTYCSMPTIFTIEKKKNVCTEFTFDDLNDSLVNSVIYYEALQEKVERSIGVSEIQAMEELLRQFFGKQLSQAQLTKLLVTVDLFESYFFWYYTKGTYINGCRLEKRANIDFQDLSAFAVSLGKFKSDYDSCLDEIVLVENTTSLVETCVYLSYGRKIVHRAIRKIKEIYYFQVILISDNVYKSFARKDKKPFFKYTQVKRELLRMDEWTRSDKYIAEADYIQLKTHKKRLDLRQILKQEDVFIFFMKNIVQNFIEIKYIHKIQRYLTEVNSDENFSVFDQKQIKLYQRHNIETVTNNQELSELKQFKPIFHSSIRHLRETLLKYCEVYELNLSFIIKSKTEHLIKIQKRHYITRQIILSNNLKILFIYKLGKRQNYSIFMYHHEPLPITIINTSFHKRFVMIKAETLIGNLVRRQKAQKYLSDDCSSVTKIIIKYQNNYCYISVSQCQSIVCWRFDFYFPHLQAHYSTFLDEQIYLECLSEWGQNDLMWHQTIKKISINIKQQHLSLHNRKIQLFKSLKRFYFDDQSPKGVLELIEVSGQLLFLIISFESGAMSIGKVQNIMFLNNKLVFSSSASCKERVGMYDNIMNHLYYKVLTGKLPAEVITAEYFIVDELQ